MKTGKLQNHGNIDLAFIERQPGSRDGSSTDPARDGQPCLDALNMGFNWKDASGDN